MQGERKKGEEESPQGGKEWEGTSVDPPGRVCTPCHPGSRPPSAHCGCCWCHELQTADAAPLQSKSPQWTVLNTLGLCRCESPLFCQPARREEEKTPPRIRAFYYYPLGEIILWCFPFFQTISALHWVTKASRLKAHKEATSENGSCFKEGNLIRQNNLKHCI